MFCTSCSKLLVLGASRFCAKCQNPITNNISVICNNCSVKENQCSSCLKKINLNNDLKKDFKSGCGCKK